MALDGSGNFTRLYNWVADRNATINITASRMDAEFDGIVDALDLALYRDGRAAFTADQSMGGNQLTNVGDPVGSADAVPLAFADARYLLKAQLAAGMPVNASIAASVGSNALTIALKDASGADPSSSSPVLLPFRSATATTGTITTRSVTAATSLVISSGSTLGTTSAFQASIWVVAFDDGGTVRLGAINCLTGVTIAGIARVFNLEQQGIASSTAEGGAGGADSAHTFYTGTAVTSKPYIILGRLIYNTALGTAGTWSAAPDIIVNMAPGVKTPGETVQIQRSADAATATGTTTMPFDDTIPQSTEGDQYMSQAITPTVATNVIKVTHRGNYASSNTDGAVIVALFIDSAANAYCAASFSRNAAANSPAHGTLTIVFAINATTATTFKIRAGTPSAGTTRFNGSGAARLFGGVCTSELVLEEIVA